MKRTALKRRTPLRRGPWKRKPKSNMGVGLFDGNARQALQAMRLARFKFNKVTPGLEIPVIFGRITDPRFKSRVVKPRKRLPRQSASMKKKWSEYEKAKREWREERIKIDGYLRCEFVSPETGFRCRRHAMKSPHHRAGREGKNLADKSKFMANCFTHHRWIDEHRKQAEALGYIIRERQKH